MVCVCVLTNTNILRGMNIDLQILNLITFLNLKIFQVDFYIILSSSDLNLLPYLCEIIKHFGKS